MTRSLRIIALLIFATAAAAAQYERPGLPHRDDITYDGRFTFVRLRWGAERGFRRGGFGSAWNHDYPRAEQNLSLILQELTEIDIRTDGSRVLMLDDPELFKYPIAFMWSRASGS